MTKRTCSVDGCRKPHRARGLCSSHYNATYQPNRHAPKLLRCAACGVEVLKQSGGGEGRRPACSYRCRYYLQHGHYQPLQEVVGPIPRVVRDAPPTPRNDFSAPLKVRFVACKCAECGVRFTHDTTVTGTIPRYCTPRCSKRHHRRAYKERNGDAVPLGVRVAVYIRDDGVCQLCGGAVAFDAEFGPLSATLDHIVPQSHQIVPDHSESNLRLAHMICNSIRGDRIEAAA